MTNSCCRARNWTSITITTVSVNLSSCTNCTSSFYYPAVITTSAIYNSLSTNGIVAGDPILFTAMVNVIIPTSHINIVGTGRRGRRAELAGTGGIDIGYCRNITAGSISANYHVVFTEVNCRGG